MQVLRLKGVRPYIPDFKLAFEHFCIHTGGRGVIDAIEKQLELRPANVAPSRETLFRYGNVSSASIWCVEGRPCGVPRVAAPGGGALGWSCRWVELLVRSCCLTILPPPKKKPIGTLHRYVLSNIETKQGVRRGERVWQIAFGSGFKCNSAVWRALRTVNDRHDAWLEDGRISPKASPKV